MKKTIAMILLAAFLCGCNFFGGSDTSAGKPQLHTGSVDKSDAVTDFMYNKKTETVTIVSIGKAEGEVYEKLQSIECPTKLVISKGVKAIPDYFFSYSVEGNSGSENNHFNKIKSVSIPDTVTEIGECAFSGCSGIETVSLSDNLTKLGKYAFEDCKGLKSVKLGKGLITLPFGAFFNCEKLSEVSFSEGMTRLGNESFKCTGLKKVVLPQTLNSIGESVFDGCVSLEAVVLPNQLFSIGKYAFFGCEKLGAINVPKSVEMISDYALGYVTENGKADNAYALKTDFVIKGYSSSAAEEYASANKIKFEKQSSR